MHTNTHTHAGERDVDMIVGTLQLNSEKAPVVIEFI